MRFGTYRGMQGGIMNALGSMLRPNTSYDDTVRDLAYYDNSQANIGKLNSETALNDQQYQARSGIERELQSVPLPQGMTPGLASKLFVGSAKPSMHDYSQAMGDAQDQHLRVGAQKALEAGNSQIMNSLLAISGRDPYTPYTLNETGRIDTGTGQVDFTPGHGALVNQRNAAAAQSMAGARENDAQARAAGFLEVSPGATVYNVPQGGIVEKLNAITTAPPNPASGSPSSDMKQYQELLGLGMDAETARGVSYGTIKQVTDARGNIVLVDVASGRIAGSLTTDPRTGQAQWQPAQQPAAQSPAQQPPMQGARQAPDGNWYVQQNGQWFRVDQ